MHGIRQRVVGCTLTGYGPGTGDASVLSISYDLPARVGRALTGVGAAWAAAIPAVFIPVAYLILVSGLVAFGLYLFWRRWHTEGSVQRACGTCPDCGSEQEFDIAGNWEPPHHVTCQSCQRSLVLSVAGD
jgi:hypothetical protein